MDGIGGVVAEKCYRIVFENVKKLNQVHAAGTRWRHGENIVATIGAVHRFTYHGTIVFQIVDCDQTAVRRHVRGDLPGNVAAVKCIGPLTSDLRQTPGQIALHELLTAGQCRAVGVEKDLRCCRVPRQSFLAPMQIVRQLWRDGDAVACQSNGRLHDLCETHGAVFLERKRHSRDSAGYAHGQVTETRALLVHVALRVQIHVPAGACRGHLPIVDGDRLAGFGHVHHHESATADVARPRQRDRQRESHRNSGIHRVTSLFENIDADSCGRGFLGRDHAVACEHRMNDVAGREYRGVRGYDGLVAYYQQRNEEPDGPRTVCVLRCRGSDSDHVFNSVVSVGPTRLA